MILFGALKVIRGEAKKKGVKITERTELWVWGEGSRVVTPQPLKPTPLERKRLREWGRIRAHLHKPTCAAEFLARDRVDLLRDNQHATQKWRQELETLRNTYSTDEPLPGADIRLRSRTFCRVRLQYFIRLVSAAQEMGTAYAIFNERLNIRLLINRRPNFKITLKPVKGLTGGPHHA